jgi:colanic acid biosynthesis glycosyl transferase WcaI
MQQLIFVNRYFFPDHSATSQILSDLAFHLAGAGRNVAVVTSRQIYDDPKASLPAFEVIRDVSVHRVSSSRFGRAALSGRLADYFSFYFAAWRRLRKIVAPGDTIVAKTDPPLISLVAAAVARTNGARLINWMQDVYPEIAIEAGVPFVRGPIAMLLATLRDRTLREAEANVVVGDLMGEKAKALGAPAARVHVIPNWSDDQDIKPLPSEDNPLRQTWGLQDKFVVGYSGNLGRAHEFATVLAAAEHLRDDPRIMFLVIGGGKRFDELAAAVRECGLTRSFRLMPYQDRQILRQSLAAPDAHWISLNPPLEGLVVPSKFYGVAAAGKPIIFIGAPDGEIARLVREHACGSVIEPGDADGLVTAILRLAGSAQVCRDMGQRARAMLETNFTRQMAFERWERLLSELDRRA